MSTVKFAVEYSVSTGPADLVADRVVKLLRHNTTQHCTAWYNNAQQERVTRLCPGLWVPGGENCF